MRNLFLSVVILFLSGCSLFAGPDLVLRTKMEPCPATAPKPRCDMEEAPQRPNRYIDLVGEYSLQTESKAECVEEVKNWRDEYEKCSEALED